jgi:acetyltransferase-like isoleucine patch superfamily enzyme
VGRNVSISAEVQVLTGDHDLHAPTFEGRTRSVVIGNYVFIGTRALILPGVSIGDGAAVGAGSVVTKNVPPGFIVAGAPARQVGLRSGPFEYSTTYERHCI